ncbi:MAG: alkaline phosphatase [Phycisphaerales bacterium JB063]
MPTTTRPTHARRSPRLSRRRFLQHVGLAVGAGTLGGWSTAVSAGTHVPGPVIRVAPRGGTARNVIFMVADGMSQGTWTLGDLASRLQTGEHCAWAKLWDREGTRRGLAMTHSADSLVTDSAAAGSAFGTGVHINNGALNVTPDGKTPTPLLVQAREAGLKTGLVTTTVINHATPAGFSVNMPSRNSYHDILAQQLERRVDVMLGGGQRYLSDELKHQHNDAIYLSDAQGLRGRHDPAKRVVGLFSRDHIPFELDRPATVPPLSDMAGYALDRLAAATADTERGFILQIEGGRVDHAGHNNDAMGLLHEQIMFNHTLERVMQYVDQRDDTLLIVTTDHGTADPALTVYHQSAQQGIDRLLNARGTFESIFPKLPSRSAEGFEPEHWTSAMRQAVQEALNVRLSDQDLGWLARRHLEGETTNGFAARNSLTICLGEVLANYTGVGFVSGNHTTDMVEATAYGPGSEWLEPTLDNIDLHTMMRDAIRLPA